MRVDDLSDDGEAQPRAARLRGEERAEDLLRDVGGDTRAVVLDDHDDGAGVGRRFPDRDLHVLVWDEPRRDSHESPSFERLEGVNQKVSEELPQHRVITPDGGERLVDVGGDLHVAVGDMALVFGERVDEHHRDRHLLDLEAEWPDELQHVDDDGVCHLRLVDDVVQDRLRVLGVLDLAFEQARHDLNAGERVLHFVCDGGRHLAKRRQTVAKALALLELLDPGEILEEEEPRR